MEGAVVVTALSRVVRLRVAVVGAAVEASVIVKTAVGLVTRLTHESPA